MDGKREDENSGGDGVDYAGLRYIALDASGCRRKKIVDEGVSPRKTDVFPVENAISVILSWANRLLVLRDQQTGPAAKKVAPGLIVRIDN